MATHLYKYIMALLASATVALTAEVCHAQQPADFPPLEDETGTPATDVPVVERDITRPFAEPGAETVLDNNVPEDDRIEIVNGQELRPGQTPSVNEQMPGYTSEGARLADDHSLPSEEQYPGFAPAPQQQQPLSRREMRRLRKEAKNTPPYIRDLSRDTYRINSGQKTDVLPNTEVVISETALTTVERQVPDSLDMSTPEPPQPDSLLMAETEVTDSMALLSARERRELERLQRRADTTLYRHSPIFRDTLKIAPLTAISLVVPGFGQLYNGDYWKIPVLYATAGTALAFGIQQHKQYVRYRNEYDYLIGRSSFNTNRALLDPVQTKMIQHNSWQQVLFGTAIASYVYFLCDAVINYPAADKNPVKTATTLSMICPGAGQIYNGSFWKVPLVVGGFASFIYVIDWNNRGLQRYTTAIRLASDNDPDTNPDSSFGSMSVDQMKSYQQMYRRNRDLAIILTAAFYLLNIMDAHVDAHMKDFDVSSDLACRLRIQPTIEPMYAMNSYQYSFGMGLSLTF